MYFAAERCSVPPPAKIHPVAFLNYYPTRWLLGKIAPSDPGYYLSFLSPLVALLLLSAARLVWKKGLRQYTSTGS